MSVNLEFEGEGRSGIVAEGTYLWEAAKRLGVRLPAECGGKGECDTCAVVIKEGMDLLSGLTAAERERLSPERLAAGERLACQTKIERGGDLKIALPPPNERAETSDEKKQDLRDEFVKMPLEAKLRTLVELEAVAAYETLKTIADLPFTLFGKGLDVMARRGRALEQQERAARRPAERESEKTKNASAQAATESAKDENAKDKSA